MPDGMTDAAASSPRHLKLAGKRRQRFPAPKLVVVGPAAASWEPATVMEEMRRRVDWWDAYAAVAQQVLMSASTVVEVVQQIADQVLRLSDGHSLTVTIESPDDPTQLEVRVAAGAGAGSLRGSTLPRSSSVAGSVMDANRGRLHSGTADLPTLGVGPMAVGPVLAAPIHSGGGHPRGAVVVHRRPDQPSFDATDLSVVESFARQTSLALELAEKRALHDQRQERARQDEAVDLLHDNLLQQLFSIGMTVQSAEADLRAGEASPSVRQAETHLTQAVDALNTTIQQLRATLHPSGPVRS